MIAFSPMGAGVDSERSIFKGKGGNRLGQEDREHIDSGAPIAECAMSKSPQSVPTLFAASDRASIFFVLALVVRLQFISRPFYLLWYLSFLNMRLHLLFLRLHLLFAWIWPFNSQVAASQVAYSPLCAGEQHLALW